jgi:hypothetical protein
MGPTQAAALVMQEQAKAEATRVASLRARGIAADPRPAMNMEEALGVVEKALSTTFEATVARALNGWQGSEIVEGAVSRIGRHEPSRACGVFTNLAIAFGVWGGIGGAVLYYTRSPHAGAFTAAMMLGEGISLLGMSATCN